MGLSCGFMGLPTRPPPLTRTVYSSGMPTTCFGRNEASNYDTPPLNPNLHLSVPKGPRGVPALRSGTTPTEGPTAAVPRVSIPGAVGRGVAQQRGSVQVWLRPPTAALAWCAGFKV